MREHVIPSWIHIVTLSPYLIAQYVVDHLSLIKLSI